MKEEELEEINKREAEAALKAYQIQNGITANPVQTKANVWEKKAQPKKKDYKGFWVKIFPPLNASNRASDAERGLAAAPAHE